MIGSFNLTSARSTLLARGAALVLAGAALSGCATYLKSKPADSGVKGIEYALPLPIIEVVPQTDGTVEVNVKYIPDPNNRYVVRGRSFLRDYDLDIQTENGFLKKVTLDARAERERNGLGSMSFLSGQMARAGINTYQAAWEAERDKLNRRAELTFAAREHVDDAKLTVEKAKAKLATLKRMSGRNGVSSDDVANAEVDLAVAKAELRAAWIQAADYRGGVGLDPQGNTQVDGAVGDGFWGPAYYRIKQTMDASGQIVDVRLLPAIYVDMDRPDFQATQLSPQRYALPPASEPAERADEEMDDWDE